MTMPACKKVVFAKYFLDCLEKYFNVLIKNKNFPLSLRRDVIDSPLHDGLFVEAFVLSHENSINNKNAPSITASAPLKSNFAHIIVRTKQGVTEKKIPWNKDVLTGTREYIANSLKICDV